MAGVSNQEEDW